MHAVASPEARRKSVGLAYALWACFGLFGMHRLYLGQTSSAAGLAAITLVSLPLIWSGLGLLGIVAAASWALADALLIPGMAKGINDAAATAAEVLAA